MRMIRAEHIGACLAGLVALGGCAASQISSAPPEPRPIGKDIPAFQAPELPVDGEPGLAELVEPSGALTLQDAQALALMQNPELAAFSYEVRAREAQALQAGLRPNPELEFEVENFGGSGEASGFGNAETTLSLEQLLEFGGKRGKRQRVARLEHDLAAWDYETQRIEVLTEVSKVFIVVLAAQRRVALADDLVRVAEQSLETVSRRVKVGAVSPVEETRARVALATSRVEREIVARELTAARKRLAATWGAHTANFSEASGDLERTLTPPSHEVLLDRIEQNPDLARWDTELEAQRAVLGLEKAQGVPDVGVGGGVRRLGETDDNAFLLGVAVPLAFFDRNQGAARAAEYRLEKAREERRAAGVQARAELAIAYEALLAAFEEVRALREEILPEAQLASETAADAYRKGLFRFTDVLDTQRTLFELRGRYFGALAEYHEAVADLERLVGETLEDVTRDDGRP